MNERSDGCVRAGCEPANLLLGTFLFPALSADVEPLESRSLVFLAEDEVEPLESPEEEESA